MISYRVATESSFALKLFERLSKEQVRALVEFAQTCLF
jgi:hypothetical protein